MQRQRPGYVPGIVPPRDLYMAIPACRPLVQVPWGGLPRDDHGRACTRLLDRQPTVFFPALQFCRDEPCRFARSRGRESKSPFSVRRDSGARSII